MQRVLNLFSRELFDLPEKQVRTGKPGLRWGRDMDGRDGVGSPSLPGLRPGQ